MVEYEGYARYQEDALVIGDRNAAGWWPGIPGWPVNAFYVGCIPPDYRHTASVYFYDVDHCLSEHGSRAPLMN